MKNSVLSSALALVLLASDLAGQSGGQLLADLLPVEAVDAEILELRSPPKLVDISGRLQKAAQADPEWWRSHAQKKQPGQPLPYDERMGITEPEYRHMLAMTDSIHMRPSKTVRLQLQSLPTGWRFPDDAPIPDLRGVEIDTTADVIRTPYGTLATRTTLKPSPAQKATGPWGGPQWKLENFDQASGTGIVATFAVGRLEETGHTLIYFDAKQAANGQLTRRTTNMIRLPQR